MAIYKKISRAKLVGRKLLAMLIDPDCNNLSEVFKGINKAIAAHVDYFLIGGSLLQYNKMPEIIEYIKSQSTIPVILFPGGTMQIDASADAMFLPSVISGRNADLLIGKHVEVAPIIKSSGLEVLPMGYMLIDSGHKTTVHYMSNTQPIPYNNDAIAVSTALAGEMLGLKMIYLEAGSGASKHVSCSMINAVSKEVDLPIIVGGGITTANQAEDILSSGADMIVVGNAIEENSSFIFDLSTVVHSKKTNTI